MAMKPWYKIITPREDLREGRPLDASEFAVHLDHVRDGRAPTVYQDPAAFFERTYLTKNLLDLTTQVVRRLSGIKLETSAAFNLSTQFGGGKTHSLTLLYHLAKHGNEARDWNGVAGILRAASIDSIPKASTAIFVGTEFDSITGRGGNDGTPNRKTPWGEIAFQLGGEAGFRLVAEHEAALTAPGGDVIEKILPQGPVLILLDELMNYVSRTRKSGLASQLYTFLHNLSEVARARNNLVLTVSIPASELEMNAEDHADFERMNKMLDRLGKPMVMSAEAETSEIIRRRLFEWKGLPKDALSTVDEYEAWFQANKQQLPSWFPTENAREALKASYPFHPALLSVFERKWRGLPRFQQTRGVLRLLALWVSKAYAEGYQGAHKDPLISLGTAPVDDALFRAALFQQLGEARLEPAVTTDIAGKEHAHALRLDAEATPEVKKARLHRKVATSILFESNGGQLRAEATLPEVRFAVAEPGLDIGSVEQCLEALTDACYFLGAERNRYRFSFQPNLNKLLADRRASVGGAAVDDRVRKEIQKVFSSGAGVERVYFPKKSNDVPDRAALTLIVMGPDNLATEAPTKTLMTTMTTECGSSSRTFKSALIWAVAEDAHTLQDEARKLLAWREIDDDASELKLDDTQKQQLVENTKRAERDLREAVWRAYKNVFLLADDNSLRKIDLGLVHSSASSSMVELILSRLKQEDIVVDGVSPNFLTRYWPPALPEWSTKSVRDAFYASPKFPRLLNADAVKTTISSGLGAGTIAYVGKTRDGSYEPFVYKKSMGAGEVVISDDTYLILRDAAEAYQVKKAAPPEPPVLVDPIKSAVVGPPGGGALPIGGHPQLPSEPPPGPEVVGFEWTGEVPPQKWMNFYTKVLSKFATGGGLRLMVMVEVAPPGGTTVSKIEETKSALRDLGLSEDVVSKK
ncbi:MAG: ATP-binding protein [Deltaproteobacteria bacterium]|nr:ATP-binding protein [Deltaproteobacteria bacterium]